MGSALLILIVWYFFLQIASALSATASGSLALHFQLGADRAEGVEEVAPDEGHVLCRGQEAVVDGDDRDLGPVTPQPVADAPDDHVTPDAVAPARPKNTPSRRFRCCSMANVVGNSSASFCPINDTSIRKQASRTGGRRSAS